MMNNTTTNVLIGICVGLLLAYYANSYVLQPKPSGYGYACPELKTSSKCYRVELMSAADEGRSYLTSMVFPFTGEVHFEYCEDSSTLDEICYGENGGSWDIYIEKH